VILAGDIGGTKTNLGLFEVSGDQLVLREFRSYKSAESKGLGPLVQRFFSEAGGAGSVAAACFGIAGPVVHNAVATPNLAWQVQGSELASDLSLPAERLLLLNDLVATAEGIPLLATSELATLQKGVPEPEGNRVLLAAGTGLGMAFLPRVGNRWLPVSSEGGHADFAPRTDEEMALLRFLQKRQDGHVSVERVLSGPGLASIYDFLRDDQGVSPDPAIERRMEKEDAGQVITEGALSGGDPLSQWTLGLFVSLYGAAAGNLALLGTAVGGVYLGGGIAPKILAALEEPAFREAFSAKGRFVDYLRRIPIQVILNDRTALLGAARRAAGLIG
jgi:glucokinase